MKAAMMTWLALVILVVPVFSEDAVPVVSVQQSSIDVYYGYPVTLGCTINSTLPLINVFWQRISYGTLDNITTTNSKYSGGNVTIPSLTIVYAEFYDRGFYYCFASNNAGTGQSSDTYLDVFGYAPFVRVYRSQYSAIVGRSVLLGCDVHHYSYAFVQWTRLVNNQTINLNFDPIMYMYSGYKNLIIHNVTKSDEGFYTCTATNSFGTGSAQTYLNVYDNATVTITELTTEGEMVNGRNMTVSCKAYVWPTAYPFITWKLNNSIINPTDSTRWMTEYLPTNNSERWQFRLTVMNMKTSDSGMLTCKVSDGYINSEQTLTLNVIGKPTVYISPRTSTAKIGDIVHINCTVVDSYSVSTSILWHKNSRIFYGNKDEIIIRTENAHTSQLVIYGIQNSAQYACSGINNYGEGGRLISHITVTDPDNVYQYCPSIVDQFGSDWGITIENAIAINQCPGDRTGTTSRFCNGNGKWEEPNYSTCVSKDLLILDLQSDFLRNGVEVKDVNSILLDLNTITKPDIRRDLTSGELEISSNILGNIAYYAKERVNSLSVDQLEIFVSSCDNLLREKNTPGWEQLKQLNFKGITRIAKAVTVYTKAYTYVNDSVFQRTVQKDQLVVQVGKVSQEDITFPRNRQVLPDWIAESTNQVTLNKENFKGQQPVGYSTTYYRNISNLFHQYYISEGVVTTMNGSYDVNSVVIDFSIEPTPTKLQLPLVVKFDHLRSNYSYPVCAFWDFDTLNTPNGAWSLTGSKLFTTSQGVTICQYDHTTNFALLMSPEKAPSLHSRVLSKISAAGCGISIAFLVVTVIIHTILWRHLTRDTRGKKLKRDKEILLVNLCVALTISYILFLVGITLTNNKKVCSAMAALLHYIFLVDFAFMLAEGIEIAISIRLVFLTSSRTKWLIPACWVSPAVIVGISMGATKLDGYGNSQYCWLSIESKLIWTFVGPVLTVILINFIILILVMKTMFATHAMMDKTTKERAKAGIRSLCVILPLFGVTWVLGVFSVNDETVVFQYLFAVFNSLQGFFIFLFHTVLNQQVRDGIQKMRGMKADKSSTYSQKDATRESSVPSIEFNDILKTKTQATAPVNGISNSKYSHQNNTERDNEIASVNSTTPKDVPGPIKNDNTKETKVRNKSRLDKDDQKPKQSDDRRDVVFQRSHTLAPGKQNRDAGYINQRVQRRSQYNINPESNNAYYYDRPFMSYGETRWPYVGSSPYTFGYKRHRRPDKYHHQKGNTFSWSADG